MCTLELGKLYRICILQETGRPDNGDDFPTVSRKKDAEREKIMRCEQSVDENVKNTWNSRSGEDND